MSTPTIFEKIKRTNAIGQEYWSARELFKALEYIKWDKFLNVIAKAKEACLNSGHDVELVAIGRRQINPGVGENAVGDEVGRYQEEVRPRLGIEAEALGVRHCAPGEPHLALAQA